MMQIMKSDTFNSELEQIADLRMAYDEYGFPVNVAIVEIDSEIIRQAGALGNFIFDEGHYDDEMKDHWVWNPGMIARGKYPLEKLPDHVREIARKLYYVLDFKTDCAWERCKIYEVCRAF